MKIDADAPKGGNVLGGNELRRLVLVAETPGEHVFLQRLWRVMVRGEDHLIQLPESASRPVDMEEIFG